MKKLFQKKELINIHDFEKKLLKVSKKNINI